MADGQPLDVTYHIERRGPAPMESDGWYFSQAGSLGRLIDTVEAGIASGRWTADEVRIVEITRKIVVPSAGCYLIRYPSGASFTAQGRFLLVPLGSLLVPMVFLDNSKEALSLDPRAIVEKDGVEVYSPRRNRDGLEPGMAKWLDEHKEWATDGD